jgi:hypothetical protein
VIENIQNHFVFIFKILNVANKKNTEILSCNQRFFFFWWLIYLEKCFFKKKSIKIFPFFKKIRPKSKKNKSKKSPCFLHIAQANSQDIKGF